MNNVNRVFKLYIDGYSIELNEDDFQRMENQNIPMSAILQEKWAEATTPKRTDQPSQYRWKEYTPEKETETQRADKWSRMYRSRATEYADLKNRFDHLERMYQNLDSHYTHWRKRAEEAEEKLANTRGLSDKVERLEKDNKELEKYRLQNQLLTKALRRAMDSLSQYEDSTPWPMPKATIPQWGR